MCGACSLSGGEESYIHGLVGIPEGMRSLGKLDVDANIKWEMNLQGKWYGYGLEWCVWE